MDCTTLAATSTHTGPVVSIVTTCKGRLHHLRETLPLMLVQKFDFPFEVIVVDYGCPQGTFDWMQELDCQNLVGIRVGDRTYPFNLSRARNCGASFASAEILAFVDADMRAHRQWLGIAAAPVLEGAAGLCKVASIRQRWDRAGTCVVLRQLYEKVRGYDEQIVGWGAEDGDFYARCKEWMPVSKYPPWLLKPISHTHEERSRYYLQDWKASDKANHAYLLTRSGIVNRFGYGQGVMEVFRGRRDELPPIRWLARPRIRRKLRHPSSC